MSSMVQQKFLKENFIWLPLLIIAVLDLIYLFTFGFLQMLTRYLEGDPLASRELIVFIADSVIVRGAGLPVILGAIVCGACIGLIAALFRKKPLDSSLKKRIVYFLILFYLLIGFSLFYLMNLPPNPIRS